MTTARSVTEVGEPLYRLGRLPDPLAWPPWEFAGTGRFDDPLRSVRTLYAALERRACFIESLAPFRPSLTVLARMADVTGTGEPIPRRIVPADWYRKRGVGQFRLRPAQPLLDLRSLETREVLRVELAKTIEDAGLADLDVSGACGPARAVTQAIARWAFGRGFEGILYSSRLDSSLTCVAVFEGVAIEPVGLAEPIRTDDPDLRAIAEIFNLAL